MKTNIQIVLDLYKNDKISLEDAEQLINGFTTQKIQYYPYSPQITWDKFDYKVTSTSGDAE